MEAIKGKESVPIRVFRVFRAQKNKSELFGTMRNDAEPCGYFRMARVVSLHCLSGRIAILVHKECILTDGRMVILYRTHVK